MSGRDYNDDSYDSNQRSGGYGQGNQGDSNYIDSDTTRTGGGSGGGVLDKAKDAMGMGSSNRGDSDSYGSGNTGSRYDSSNTDTYGSSGNTSSGYGSRDKDTYGSSGNTGSSGYGDSGIGGGSGIGNDRSTFTDQPMGSSNDGDAFANKRADGSRTLDDFTSGDTRSGGYGSSNTDDYGSGNTRTGGSGGYGSSNTDDYGSSNTRTTGSGGYGSGDRDTYGSSTRSGDDYSSGNTGSGGYGSGDKDSYESGNRKEGMMDKIKDKMGMSSSKDKYDDDNKNY